MPAAALPQDNDDPRAEKEWRKIGEELRRHHVRQAREKLDKWEEHFGVTAESQALRQELDRSDDD